MTIDSFKETEKQLNDFKARRIIPTTPTPESAVEATRQMLEDRRKRYGSFTGHAAVTQKLKVVMRSHPNYNKLSEDKKEALEMIQHKIGRILNGDPEYADSWIDIVGYAQLVVDDLAF